MTEVIGSVQVHVGPDTTGFAKDARKDIERQFGRRNALKIDFEVDRDSLIEEVVEAREAAQRHLNLKVNKLKVNIGLDWSKRDITQDLKQFKTDVEARQLLDRPTVYADFDIDRRGLEKLRENVRLNVTLDERSLQRAINKATESVTVFGDRKVLERKTSDAAQLASRVFQDVFDRRRLKLDIDANAEELEKAQRAMEEALRVHGLNRESLRGTEDALADITTQFTRQAEEVEALKAQWQDLEDSGEANARQMSYYANHLREAEDTLAELNRQQARLAGQRDRLAFNVVEPNIEGIRRAQREFEELEESLDDKTAEIGVIAERTSFAAVSTELMLLARDRVATIWARFQRTPDMRRFWANAERGSERLATNMTKYAAQITGLRLMWRTIADMVEIMPKLDMIIPRIAAITVGAVSAISAASAALTSVLTIGGDMLDAFQLVYMLPSVLAGAAGSALILGRAFYDFQDTFPDIVRYYEDLGDIVSSRVWGQAEDNLRSLHRATRPFLNTHVPEWAAAWGDSLGALADGLRVGVANGHLEEFLKNSIEGTKAAETGWNALGSALMRMIGIGSRHFPDLGRWFSTMMNDFENWVSANDAQGNFERWIDEATQSLRDMGSVAWSVGGILKSLAEGAALAGAPSLADFAGMMRGLREIMAGEGFQEAYTEGLSGMFHFMEEIMELAPQFGESLETIWNLLGQASTILATPIQTALSGIMDGLNSPDFHADVHEALENFGEFLTEITPGLETLIPEMASLFQIVSVAAREWAPAFNDILLMFADIGSGIHPGLESFLETTGPALHDMVEDLREPVLEASEAIGDLLGNEGFQEFASEIIEGLGRLGEIALEVVPALTDLGEAFGDWFDELDEHGQDVIGTLTALGLVLPGVAIGVALLAKPVRLAAAGFSILLWPLKQLGKLVLKIPGVRGALETLQLRFMYFVDWLKGLPATIGRALANIPGAIGRGFAAIGRALTGAGRAIWGALRSLPGLIGRGLSNLPGLLGRIFAPLGRFISGIPGAIAKLVPKGGILRLIGSTALRVLTGPVGWAWLLTDLLNLIKPVPVMDWIGRMLDKMGLGDSFVANFLDGWTDAFERSFGADAGLMQMFSIPYNMLVKGWQGAVEGWQDGGLWGAIKGAFSGLGEGFLDTFEFGWYALENILNAWFPESAPAFFEDPWGKIGEWLGISGGRESEFMGASSGDIEALNGRIQALFRGLWKKLQSWIDQGLSWVEDQISGWSPTSGGGKFVKELLGRLRGLLGFDNNGNFSFDTMVSSWKEFGGKLWHQHIRPWLVESWDNLVDWVSGWEPVAAVIDFFEDPLGTILGWLNVPDWLWNSGGTGAIVTGEGVSGFGSADGWGYRLWENHIKPWLVGGWDELVAAIMEWEPVEAIIALFSDPWGTIAGWLGIDSWFDGLGEGAGTGVGLGASWGAKFWTDHLKPWLDGGWSDLQGSIGGWAPGGAGEGGPEGGQGSDILPRALGVDPGGLARLGERFAEALGLASGFSSGVQSEYSAMNAGTGISMQGLRDGTVARFMETNSLGRPQMQSLSAGVQADASAMRAGAVSSVAGLSSGISSHMSSARSSGTAQMQSLSSESISSANSMATGVVAAGSRANNSFVAQMSAMRSRSIGQANQTRTGVLGGLSFSAASAGGYVGNTFRSGLGGGLNAAVGLAYSMAGRIRGALSFSAFGSGASIGSSFAAGLRSRRSAITIAANGLAAAARAQLPNSPADEGPFSGSGWGGWGESIADELARGLRKGAPQVADEANRMMSAVSMATTGGVNIAGPNAQQVRTALSGDEQGAPNLAGAQIHVNVESTSEDPLEDGRRLGGDIRYALEGAGL